MRDSVGLKILRKHTPRPEETITRFEQMGGILLLDGDRILYFVPNKDAKSRALLAELWEHREGVKRIIEDYVRRLTEQGRYEKIKAEICRRIPPSLLSPLDEFKDAVKNSGNSARTPGGEGDK